MIKTLARSVREYKWSAMLSPLCMVGEVAMEILIPLVIAEFALFGYTLYHILTHNTYKRGNRTLWLIVTIVLMKNRKISHPHWNMITQQPS